MMPADFLFLDRDGVINRRLPGAYVTSWTEFRFLPGVLNALSRLRPLFRRIFVITNQQGIGKALMTEADLLIIHQQMAQSIEQAGGRLDAIYYCPHLATANCLCRKPNPGLALQAQVDFPEVDFRRALLVGDSLSDLQLGLRLNMQTVLVDTQPETLAIAEKERIQAAGISANGYFATLGAFTDWWIQQRPGV